MFNMSTMHHINIDILVAMAILVLDFVIWRGLGGRFGRIRLVTRLVSFLALTYVLLKSGMSPFGPAPWTEDKPVHFFAQCIELLWWLQVAKVASTMLDREVLPALWNRERLFRDVLSAVIFVAAAVAALGYVLEIPVRGLLATSGALAVILGLAIQSTLGDVFSGIVLNATEPFGIGDWVFVGDIEGEVVESNWRATSLLNPHGNVVVIPNSVAAKASIVNHSRPPSMHGVSILLEIAPEEPAGKVIEALEYAAAGAVDVLAVPRPVVKAKRATTDSIEYEIIAYVDDLQKKIETSNALFDLSQRHLAASGILMRSLSISKTPPGPLSSAEALLHHVEMFRTLTDSQLAVLAASMSVQDFSPGQVIERAGASSADDQQTLLIVARGIATLCVDRDGHEVELRRMSPGDSIGQSAILAGVRVEGTMRAKTSMTVYALKRDALTPILRARPEIAKHMCRVLAQEFAHDQSLLSRNASSTETTESFLEWLHDGIRHLHDLVINDK
jgi:small-conductance mechanosensitive channel/CRP-like cAMP-binding protein